MSLQGVWEGAQPWQGGGMKDGNGLWANTVVVDTLSKCSVGPGEHRDAAAWPWLCHVAPAATQYLGFGSLESEEGSWNEGWGGEDTTQGPAACGMRRDRCCRATVSRLG